MNTRALAHRAAAVAIGATTLAFIGGGTAVALDDPYGDSDVNVSVDIAEIDEPGTLAMTVSGTSTTLTENGSTATNRQFTGTLPTVTVTDTRDASEIADGAYWYVLGSITDFTGTAGQPTISSADSFGWTPRLIAGDPGSVAAGDEVDPGEGFTDSEILAVAYDSAEINPEGSWSANADLTLLTPGTVEPGQYSATLTLSLFE